MNHVVILQLTRTILYGNLSFPYRCMMLNQVSECIHDCDLYYSVRKSSQISSSQYAVIQNVPKLTGKGYK